MFECKKSHKKAASEVQIPVRPLARYAQNFRLAAWHHGVDCIKLPASESVIGHFKLEHIDQAVFNKVKKYLVENELSIGSQDSTATRISDRNLFTLAQLSSVGHLFGMQDLQDGAMHSLWHYLITMRQEWPKEKLECEMGRMSKGCPAHRLTGKIVQNQESHFDNETAEVAKTLWDRFPTNQIPSLPTRCWTLRLTRRHHGRGSH